MTRGLNNLNTGVELRFFRVIQKVRHIYQMSNAVILKQRS